jgi:hypothetical protein
MKNIILIAICLTLGIVSKAQVFNTAKTLNTGTFAIGIEPMVIANGGSDFILFGHIGYGLAKDIDISAKAGILANSNYYGADVEFGFLKNFSLSAGAHVWGDFGLDATFLGSFDVASNVNIFGGADLDLNFGDDVYTNFWIPIGVEVELNKTLAFIMEASIGIDSNTPHLFGGGVNVYF